MKKLFLIIGFQFLIQLIAAQENNIREVLSPEAYRQKLNHLDTFQIIDVRTPMEYNAGHIKEAVNISYIGFRFAAQIRKLNPALPTFIYCQSEHRSPLAARRMREMGFHEIYDLEKGFKKWIESGLPVSD